MSRKNYVSLLISLKHTLYLISIIILRAVRKTAYHDILSFYIGWILASIYLFFEWPLRWVGPLQFYLVTLLLRRRSLRKYIKVVINDLLQVLTLLWIQGFWEQRNCMKSITLIHLIIRLGTLYLLWVILRKWDYV